MRKYVIATHGNFSTGIKSALDIIAGNMEYIECIEAYAKENKGIQDEVDTIIKRLGEGEELVIFTDLVGGSVTNEVLRCALPENVHLVAGINLPLLLEVLMSDEDEPTGQVIEEAIENARAQMVYVTRLLESKKGSEQQ